MEVSTYVKIEEKSSPVKRALRPLFKFLTKQIDDGAYGTMLSEYPQWFVTDRHKQIVFPDRNPDLVTDREVVDRYLEVVEEVYIHCMFYVFAAGVFTVLWYALALFLVNRLIVDLSWTVVGISYNFLGTIMLARQNVGPSHFTARQLADSHNDPLLLVLGDHVTTRLKEHLGLTVIAWGFLITFIAESGFLKLIF